MNDPKPITAQNAAKVISVAWQTGRSIVPVIGAGASVDAGVPPLALVVRYIGAVHAFVTRSLYLPIHNGKPTPDDPLHAGIKSAYQEHVDRFLLEHGWPDRFALQHALAKSLQDDRGLDGVIDDSLNCIASTLNEWASQKLLSLPKSDPPISGSEPKDLLLDWRPLVRHITNFRKELADALFLRLHHGRIPGMSHHYLAFLTKLLGIRGIFTFNFDPLIELAFAAEGLSHQLFAMEAGRTLPPPVLISPPAIIKMHGSTHNLLIDERVDFPLDDEYKRRFIELVGPNPLLLVIGCSGAERRLRDLVDCVIEARLGKKDDANPAIIWTHYVLDTNQPAFKRDAVNSIRLCSFRDAGLLLSHIYFALTSRFPASSNRYIAHAVKFYPSASADDVTDVYHNVPHLKTDDPDGAWPPRVLLISGMSDDGAPATPTLPSLANYIGSIPIGYLLVYVDLEDHHSVGGVIADILHQFRQSDSSVMPLLLPVGSPALPVGDAGISIQAAARRVILGLARQKIALVFDGLDTFEWRATTHHGVTTASRNIKDDELPLLGSFLKELIDSHSVNTARSDSVICLTIDEPVTRHKESEREPTDLTARRAALDYCVRGFRGVVAYHHTTSLDQEKEFTGSRDRRVAQLRSAPCDFLQSSHDLFLKLLATVRRTRSVNLIRAMYAQVHGDTNDIDMRVEKEISPLVRDRSLMPLEGGYFAMDRVFRNMLYDSFTRFTSSEHLARVTLQPKIEDEAHRLLPWQLLNSLALHDFCARWYYNNAYLPSRDSFCFFEYIYHRVSSLRSLTDIIIFCESNTSNNSFLVQLSDSSTPRGRRGAGGIKPGPQKPPLMQLLPPILATTPDEIRSKLHRLHARWMSGLHKSWDRTEATLRNSIAPERLLSWCETLLKYDLARNISPNERCDHLEKEVIKDIYPKPSKKHIKRRPAWSRCSDGLKAPRKAVSSSQVRCYYERGDFLKMIQMRHDDLRRQLELDHPNETILAAIPAAESPVITTKKVVVAFASLARREVYGVMDYNWREMQHWILDIAVALHWHVFACGDEELDKELNGTWQEIFEGLEELSPPPDQGEHSVDREAFARLQYIDIEHTLGCFSLIGTRALSSFGEQIKNPHDRLKRLQEVAEEGVSTLIDDTEESGYRMHNPFLNATDDRTLLIPYRSLFRTLKGRVYAMSAVRLQEPERPSFQMAYREFELARGSIGKANQALFTLCEISSADAAVAHARVCQGFEKGDCVLLETLDRQASKLRSAWAYLGLAEKGLRSGGRHILLWRAFALTKGNAIVMSVFNDISRTILECGESVGAKVNSLEVALIKGGRIARLLREGLQSIRDGLDHTPVSARRYHAGFFEIWHDLLGASFVAYVATQMVASHNAKRDRKTFVRRFLELWVHMNAGVDIHIGDVQSVMSRLETLLLGMLDANEVTKVAPGIIDLTCRVIHKLKNPPMMRDLWASYGDEWSKRLSPGFDNRKKSQPTVTVGESGAK